VAAGINGGGVKRMASNGGKISRNESYSGWRKRLMAAAYRRNESVSWRLYASEMKKTGISMANGVIIMKAANRHRRINGSNGVIQRKRNFPRLRA
jgi:hypothetical protein